MSYILDALKKAERERKLVKVPTIETVHEFPKRERTLVRPISIVAAAVLCLVIAIFFGVRKTGLEEQVLENPIPTATEDSVWSSEHTAALPFEVPVPVSTPAQINHVKPEVETSSKPGLMPGSMSEVPEIIAMAPESSERVENVPSPSVTTSVQPQINVTQLQYPPASPVRPKAPAVVSSISFRDIVTTMVLSVHLYSDNIDERMVFINGRKYLEGDNVLADCVVAGITPEGVVLQRGDERVTLRLGASPIFH